MIPPFDLVQLSTIPESKWRGLPVFHPMEQRGDVPIWEITDEDRADAIAVGDPIPDDEKVAYDVGVVLDWEHAEHDPGSPRVRFLMSMGSTLRYGSYNLWVPREMVQGITGPV